MRFEEYRLHDAVGLARLIARREVSAEEVLETAIARAEQVNPAINAIVHKQYDKARQAVAAGLPDGPLTGVPYLIKDLGFFETGEPATFGSSLFKDFVADHETAYVARCRKAGLVLMGRSTTPEFGLNPNTEPRLYGSCRNPWNLEYSPGGSSGGAAAAVAAGILPVAHATDGGGSIRIPAAQCGLFGLKPSRGRVSLAPDAGEGWGGLSAAHVVSRTVRDSALMLDCTAGPEPGDPYAAPTPERPFLESRRRSAAPAQDRSDAEGSSRRRSASRVPEGRRKRRQAVRQPRPRGRGGGPRARPGGAAADECQDRGGQHRPDLRHALEGAGPRAQCR